MVLIWPGIMYVNERKSEAGTNLVISFNLAGL